MTSRKLAAWRHAHTQVKSAGADLAALGDDHPALRLHQAILNGRLQDQALRYLALSKRDRAIANKEMNP